MRSRYFSILRDAQIGDLANELGISTNPVSQRLRRAMTNLTGNMIRIFTPGFAIETE
jgi:predicted DNA binding protein